MKEFEQLCEMYKNLQTENYQLRDYIINLQSRLLETQGEIPPAPANIDLSRPHGEPPSQQQGEQQQSSSVGLSEREIGELRMAAAQAAAAARQQEHHGSDMNNGGKHHHEEAAYLPSEYPEKRQKVDDTPASSGNDISILTLAVDKARSKSISLVYSYAPPFQWNVASSI